jgi:DNA-binding CsgD family transcriptional regulator
LDDGKHLLFGHATVAGKDEDDASLKRVAKMLARPPIDVIGAGSHRVRDIGVTTFGALFLLMSTSGTAALPLYTVAMLKEACKREVLELMTEGLRNTDIAERLVISEKTVRNHASNAFDKLGVWSRAQAIVFARSRLSWVART